MRRRRNYLRNLIREDIIQLHFQGSNTQDEREEAIQRLEMDCGNMSSNAEKTLDYIFTVDIFNEGVDIPEVNQIIMLRPTISAIVFVQQLGVVLENLIIKNM